MKQKTNLIGYIYLLPYLTVYCVFIGIPLFSGIYISMHRWSLTHGREAFVGLKYYLRLFSGDFVRGPYFWNSLWVTLQFVLYFVPILLIISLGLALLIYQCKNKTLRAFGQFSFLVPTAISISVIAILWRVIFGYDGGVLNFVLSLAGISPKPWLTDLPWAWFSIILPTLWMTCGWNMILFIVGLQRIPDSLYEAARVDGANVWQSFRHITLPGLKPITIFIVVTQIIGAFNLFAQPQLLTSGGPGIATTPVMLFLYNEAYQGRYARLGSAIAMGFVTGVIVIAIVLVIYLVFSRKTD